jgi:hypothetical protein
VSIPDVVRHGRSAIHSPVCGSMYFLLTAAAAPPTTTHPDPSGQDASRGHSESADIIQHQPSRARALPVVSTSSFAEPDFLFSDERLPAAFLAGDVMVTQFVLCLALCHECQASPHPDDRAGYKYASASPDEVALVRAAAKLGIVFVKRDLQALHVEVARDARVHAVSPDTDHRDTYRPGANWRLSVSRVRAHFSLTVVCGVCFFYRQICLPCMSNIWSITCWTFSSSRRSADACRLWYARLTAASFSFAKGPTRPFFRVWACNPMPACAMRHNCTWTSTRVRVSGVCVWHLPICLLNGTHRLSSMVTIVCIDLASVSHLVSLTTRTA